MNICTLFCLLPSAIREKGRILEVDGPFGRVEVEGLRECLTIYRGSSLRNDSVRLYLRHTLAELRRILARPANWRRESGRSRITDPDAFFAETFRPWTRERDLLERWRTGEPGDHPRRS